MVKQHLEVFARIKPYSYSNDVVDYNVLNHTIEIQTNRNKLSNAKEVHVASLNKIFQEKTNQNQIFEYVAKPVIDNCLEGYNGTIFAYGQTGSGKTFTMSGGDDWEERGIIPRVLSYVFQQFKKKSKKYSYQLNISFIEIYNQNAYDLLDQKHTQNNFQQWTKIIFMEDEQSILQMKNVGIHNVKNQQEALNLHMMGNYIRKINSTQSNQTSSRSHCIFTLNIKGKNLSNLSEVYSKIHLVDLAGSQRISKSKAEGIVLTQAKSINLSLTYLQQVIVSLNQKIKNKGKVPHIPYRNSLLTTFLKDSLGGNCKTVMIATISLDKNNQQETLSTLKFAQRVKLVENEINKNEKNIYSNRIQILEKENANLKRKVARLQGQTQNRYNHDEEEKRVEEYMNSGGHDIEIQNMAHAKRVINKMKEMYQTKISQYLQQITFISQKLQRYDEIVSQKHRKSQI